MTDSSTVVQILLILISLAGLILNIIFVYVPVAQIQSEIQKASHNVDIVAAKIDNLIKNWEPKIDQLLVETSSIEQKVSSTYFAFGLDKVSPTQVQLYLKLASTLFTCLFEKCVLGNSL